MKKELYDALCVIKDECADRPSCKGCPLEIGKDSIQCLAKEWIPCNWDVDDLEAVDLPPEVKKVLVESGVEESELEYKVKMDEAEGDFALPREEEPKPSFAPAEKRKRVLDDAIDAVCRDRCEMYGEVEDNFGVIAELWNAYLNAGMPEGSCKVDLGAMQVAEMMILFKVGRAATAMEDHRDTYVDIAGYAACAGEMCDDTSR